MSQLPLDYESRYSPREDVGAPYAKNSDTSKEAARSIADSVADQEMKVYHAIVRAGSNGVTWDQLVVQYGFSPTANGRVTSLVERGKVRDSKRRRPTRTGRNATVWVAVGGGK